MQGRRLQRGIRLFDHPLMDWGSRVHPLLPALFWGPIALGELVWGASGCDSALAVVFWSLAGYGYWLVFEYVAHRWLFHFRPPGKWLRKLYYYVHEHHHRYQERDRLMAPPLMSVSIASTMYVIAFATLGDWLGLHRVLVLLFGFTSGYLLYDYIHYYTHFARPRTKLGRFVRRCHLEHHFKSPDRWFCISFPWLDYLFGTNGTDGLRPDADHARELSRWDIDGLPAKVREHETAEALAAAQAESMPRPAKMAFKREGAPAAQACKRPSF